MLPTRDSLQIYRYTQTENEGMGKGIPCKRNQKKAGVAKFMLDRIDKKTKTIERDKEGHHITMKGSIQQEVITIVNIYVSK